MVYLSTLWVACSVQKVEPPELAPLDVNEAVAPAGESIAIVSGGDNELWWAHGAGHIHASTLAVWNAALDPEVGVDRREVDEWEVFPADDPKVDASYIVHQKVNDVITVEYDMWWRHEVQVGTVEDPQVVVVVWSKTDGTSFIDILEYSMVLTAVEEEVTHVELVGHLKAALRDHETVATVLSDLYNSLVAAAHGEPLPVY